MPRRTIAIKTNLYDLIKSLHDETGINESEISEMICTLASSGRLKWIKSKPIELDIPNRNLRKVAAHI